MPLSPMEHHEADLVQLRQLVLSPGWALYKARVLKQVQSRDRERARLQREMKQMESYGEQRQIDGLNEALDVIHQYMEGLSEDLQQSDTEPAYS